MPPDHFVVGGPVRGRADRSSSATKIRAVVCSSKPPHRRLRQLPYGNTVSSGCYSDLFPCSVGHAGQEKLRTITSSSAYYLGAHGSIAFAESLGMNFLETSAKESINVVTAFLTMSSEIKKRMTSQSAMERKSIVRIHMKGQPIQQEKAVAPLHKPNVLH